MCAHCSRTFISGSNLKQHQLVHQSKNEREKYACKFCDKVLCYITSIRRHVQVCHPMIFANFGNNTRKLINVIRGDTDSQSVSVKEEITAPYLIQRKLNYETDDKDQDNSKASHVIGSKDLLEPNSKEELRKEGIVEENDESATINNMQPTIKNYLEREISPQSLLPKEIGEEKVTAPLVSQIGKEMMEEVKEESFYGVSGVSLDRIYLESEVTDEVPLYDFSSMEHYTERGFNSLFAPEDPEYVHYE
eukprot:TRINITY_DN6820_c0_g1_i4.p1 TRINITY_DN6820_c0_g1~~TRINITY_DN6820_c0_g1_i4.p1  ORF type:complete len:248 (+),score=69.77 TRINITY_DN6820_c0_g1_i4:397-1140(+)